MAAQMVMSKSSLGGGRNDVYIATTPLRATKGPPQFLLSTAYSLGAGATWGLQHFILILTPSSSSSSPQVSPVVFDFQPQHPDNIYVALAALFGQSVPGAILERRLSQVPKKNCWLVGSAILDRPLEQARIFNGSWDTALRIGHHDCRHYVNGLAELLTGEKLHLHQLKHIYSRNTNSTS